MASPKSELGAAENAYINSLYQQAVAEGVSVFVSSGDEGAASSDYGATNATHGITVSGFTSTPYNVSVGGTDFGDTYAGTNSTYWSSTNGTAYGSALSYIPEIPWNDSCASELIADYLGYSHTYGSSGFCNSSHGSNVFPDYHRGQRRPERLRHWNAVEQRRRRRNLCGISQAWLAIGARQSKRRRARHPGRVAVRRQRSLGPLLRGLLFRRSMAAASCSGAPGYVGGIRRNVGLLADHGRRFRR